MIAFLRGRVVDLSEEALFLEVNGIGFRIFMPTPALQRLKTGEQVLIHTYLAHKEDAMLLYGFFNLSDKALFTKLINVSGVGPKTALAVLSVLSTEDFYTAILSEDTKLLSKVPGIGQKTAQRLILELKTTVEKEAKTFTPDAGDGRGLIPPGDDAVAALEALGYEPMAALRAVRTVRAENPQFDLQMVIKTALRQLMKE
ncbi:MAG TPA: Holliday junction branch migration protein RuvA [Firmicutes bacterium]|jgi:Holliday junction DNA helicase RuvA|nr:Holliday junction branch migration protein RuvA [Bacillota bacterium]